MTDGRFAGKVVIVTGAGVGIGAATAQRFAAEGATVVGVGRAEETLERTAADAEGVVEVAVGDVTDQEAVTAIIDGVAARHGRLDVIVNNAGIAAIETVEQLDAAAWSQVMATDVDGVERPEVSTTSWSGSRWAVPPSPRRSRGSSPSWRATTRRS